MKKDIVIKSIVVAMLVLGMGFAGTARAEMVSYGATAYGPSGFDVSTMNLHCQNAVYTGEIADPDVLVAFLKDNGIKRIVIKGIDPKDASRMFDAVNDVNGVRATYFNAKNSLVLRNLTVHCPVIHGKMKHGAHMIAMHGGIIGRVSGTTILGASSMAPGFVASTSSQGGFIWSTGVELVPANYQTGEGGTPLYTH